MLDHPSQRSDAIASGEQDHRVDARHESQTFSLAGIVMIFIHI